MPCADLHALLRASHVPAHNKNVVASALVAGMTTRDIVRLLREISCVPAACSQLRELALGPPTDVM